MRRIISLPLVAMITLMAMTTPVRAQLDGPRIYWVLPINTNIVAVTGIHGTINAAWSNFQRVEPSIRLNNNLYLLSYSRTLGLFGRSAMITALLPVGSVGIDASVPPGTIAGSGFVHGIADPSLGGWINLVGGPRQKVKDFIRFENGTTVALRVMGTFPLGQYDSDAQLNMGSNQWKVRVGLPIVQAFGAWVPGQRLTLEVVPSLTVSSDNSEALGQTLSQDPTISVETHLTRDITKGAFLSVDYSYLRLGKATYTDNQSGVVARTSDAVDSHLLGATAGFEVNDNLRLFVTHMQTLSEDISGVDLRGALLKVTLSWSWHSVLERLRDLE